MNSKQASKPDRVAKAKELLSLGKVYEKGCSEFVCEVLGIGYELANSLMKNNDTPIGKDGTYHGVEAGDICGWVNSGGKGHVAVYIGEQDMIFIDANEQTKPRKVKRGWGSSQEVYKSPRF